MGKLTRDDVRRLAASLRTLHATITTFRLDCRLFEEQRVAQIGTINIYIDGLVGQHRSPHFHARINSEKSGSFDIADGLPFASSLDPDEDKAITEWALENRDKLIAAWDAVGAGGRAQWIQEEI